MQTSTSRSVADALIIGAGASGSVAAKHLAEAGFSVVCLEQGPNVDPSEYQGDKPEWELFGKKRWHPNPNIRGLDNDYPCDTTESDIEPMMYNAVGGSTLLYTGHWMRFAPSDFRVRSLDGVADDWPFTYEDLEPFYDELDIEMGVSGLNGDPAYPPGNPPPLPALPIGKVGMKAAQGLDRLGWHWWPGTNTLASRPYKGRNACVRWGTCSTGCPEPGAKGSMNETHWPDALASGATLITGARVREITVNDKGLATGAIYIDRDGREHHQRANVVIVCCNGIGTPRLLLLSKSSRFPDGLANSSGLVGKNLMLHPFQAVTGYFDEPLESWLGPAGQSIYSMQFYETDESRGFVRGAKWSVTPVSGPFSMRAGQDRDPILEAWQTDLHDVLRQTVGRSFEWGIIPDDLPEETNRVTLADTLVDSDGVAAPKLTYRTSENTRRMMAFHLERAKEATLASGAVSLSISSPVRDCGWHISGTARMGNDPARSVVNQWGQAHDVENLFVYDGSVFITCSGVNPTATIAAVALRSVKHLILQRFNQRVAA